MVITVNAETRKLGKKSERKDLRKGGLTPAIIYGQGKVGTPVQFVTKDFMKAYKKSIGELAIFNVNYNGEDHRCILKAKQVHPVRRDFVHLDFLLLNPGHEVTLLLPIKFVGEPESLKVGGFVDILTRKLQITCLPKDIPEDVEVDISNLGIGDAIYVKDVIIPNVNIKDAEDIALVIIHEIKAIEEDEDEEAEESAVAEVTE
ncbi:MAG: hypothetical protein B6I17_04050 [Tenericutes bacterium 4572_104]|nr:MAG: hypothetical protein B6I17_04050 [Tenericutes bacterium 4572_104]